MNLSRRSFLLTAGAGAALLAAPGIVRAASLDYVPRAPKPASIKGLGLWVFDGEKWSKIDWRTYGAPLVQPEHIFCRVRMKPSHGHVGILSAHPPAAPRLPNPDALHWVWR